MQQIREKYINIQHIREKYINIKHTTEKYRNIQHTKRKMQYMRENVPIVRVIRELPWKCSRWRSVAMQLLLSPRCCPSSVLAKAGSGDLACFS